jgi:hypothetical protein
MEDDSNGTWRVIAPSNEGVDSNSLRRVAFFELYIQTLAIAAFRQFRSPKGSAAIAYILSAVSELPS